MAKPRGKFGWVGIPGLAGQFLEGIRPEAQVAGHAPDDRDEGLAGLDGGQVGDADLGAVGEVFVGDLQAALRLVDDVVEVVLDRNPGHERRVNAGAEEARKPNGGKITVAPGWGAPGVRPFDDAGRVRTGAVKLRPYIGLGERGGQVAALASGQAARMRPSRSW
jgi:hypothetical protein